MSIVKPPLLPKWPQHHNALVWATREIGVQEKPMGTNRGERVEFYQSFDWIVGGGYPWCVDFFQAGWAVGAKKPLPYKTAGAYDFDRWAEQQGSNWHAERMGWRRAIPGDGVVFNLGSGHMAMLEYFEVMSKGGVIVHTIDGNSLDRVKRCTRPLSDVRGFVLVPEISVIPPKVKKPRYTVVGSESGHTKVLYTGPMPSNDRLEKWLKKWNGITIKRGAKRPA